MISTAPITLESTNKGSKPILKKLEMRSMIASEALGAPFEYTLDLVSKDENLNISELLGHPMTVRLELTLGLSRYWNGFVTNVALAGSAGGMALYRVTLRPWLWLLNRMSDCRIFQKKTVPEIVEMVFRGHGLTDFKQALTSKYRQREFVVQYGETDFNFVSRLLEEEGIYYFFEQEETKHTLVLADSYGAHEATPGYETLPYYPPDEHRARDIEFIDHWELTQDIVPEAYATKDFDFERPTAPLTSERKIAGDHALKDSQIFDYPPGFHYTKKDEEAFHDDHNETPRDAYVRLALEELHSQFERVQGQTNARGLAVGKLFTLTEFPRDDQLGEYLIVSASYQLRAHELESAGPVGDEHVFRCTFNALDSARTYRPPRTATKPVIRGPQTAIVVGKDKEEIWTDEYARVKVQFHWDRYGKFNEESSCFVRVGTSWAGTNWGAIHIPRIGQEVIVEFLEGDPDRPIITGSVYNADHKPPYTLTEAPNQTHSGVKSRSTKDGGPDNFNEIRFEDEKGKEKFAMQAEKDQIILVKNDQTTTVKKNRSASVGGSDSVSVTGDRSVTVHGNLSVKVEGTGKSPTHSETTVTGKHGFHATDTIEMDAPTHIQFKVGDSIILMEPGKITITSGGKATVVLDANVLAKSNDGSKVVLDANALSEASGGAQVLLDANVLAQSKAGSSVVLDGNATMKTDGDATVDGMKVEGKGKTQASIVVGASSVAAAPAGVDVAGAAVNVNGTGNVAVMAPSIKIG
jgi:type VI secretion system secreted protein VgrG